MLRESRPNGGRHSTIQPRRIAARGGEVQVDVFNRSDREDRFNGSFQVVAMGKIRVNHHARHVEAAQG